MISRITRFHETHLRGEAGYGWGKEDIADQIIKPYFDLNGDGKASKTEIINMLKYLGLISGVT